MRCHLCVVSLLVSQLPQVLSHCIQLSGGTHGGVVAPCTHPYHLLVLQTLYLQSSREVGLSIFKCELTSLGARQLEGAEVEFDP